MRATGQRGELLVAEKLIGQGWSVAPPLGDNDPFDLLVNKGDKFLHLQVKAALEQHSYRNNRPHYQFQLAHGVSSKKRYTAWEEDFFVCCALDSNRFCGTAIQGGHRYHSQNLQRQDQQVPPVRERLESAREVKPKLPLLRPTNSLLFLNPSVSYILMVEAGGVEPPSQLNLFKTSTCLVRQNC